MVRARHALHRISSSGGYFCKFDVHNVICNTRVMVRSLYVHRIWIGIYSPINSFASANVMNPSEQGPIKSSPYNSGGFAIHVRVLWYFILSVQLGHIGGPKFGWVCHLEILFTRSWKFLQVFPFVRVQWYSCYWLIIHLHPMTALIWAVWVNQRIPQLQEVLIANRYQSQVYADLIPFGWLSDLIMGTLCFLDILIASSLCYLLATSRTGFSG